MSRGLTAAAQTAAAANEGHEFIYLGELEFDSQVREDPSNPGRPEAYLRYGVVPFQAWEYVKLEVSYDSGATWHDVVTDNADQDRYWSLSKTLGGVEATTEALLPDIEIGDAIYGRRIWVRQTLTGDHSAALTFVEVDVAFDTESSPGVPHRVLRRENTDAEWAQGVIRGLGAAGNNLAADLLQHWARIRPGGGIRIATDDDRTWISRGKKVQKSVLGTTREFVEPSSDDDGAFTVECRVRFDGDLDQEQEIFVWRAKGLSSEGLDDQDRDGFALVRTADGRLRAIFRQYLNATSGGQVSRDLVLDEIKVQSDTEQLTDADRWYSIAAGFDGRDGWVAIDGRVLATSLVAGSRKFPVIRQEIGGTRLRTGTVQRFAMVAETRGDLHLGRAFNGAIDDVRIYDQNVPGGLLGQRFKRELNAAEVSRLESEAGLVLYYDMNDRPGRSAINKTSAGPNGKLLEYSSGFTVFESGVGWQGRQVPGISGFSHPYRISPVLDLWVQGNTQYVTDAAKDIEWNGNTYIGVGKFGGVLRDIEDTAALEARGIELVLSGIDPAHVSLALSQHYVDRPCRVYGAFLDENGDLVIDPFLLFEGRMDTMPVEIGDRAAVKVTCENHLIDWERARMRRWNDLEQQRRFPGDLGLSLIAITSEKEIWWPARLFESEGG